jgi:ubiquinone/menaquinone biosynthesis C-methylase UbiE
MMPFISQVRPFLLIAVCLTANACTEAIYRSMNDPARDEWQQPQAVIESLKIGAGAQIADLGAGGGYFTFPLADATGPEGRVYAVDIEKESLRFIQEEGAQRGGLPTNIQLVLASPERAGLPEKSIDLIFTCNTYHHLPNRPAYMKSLAEYLRQGGRIAIIDFKPSGWLWLFGHTTAKETVREEMTSAGYRLLEEFEYLPKQHFQIFVIAAP